MSKFFDTLYQIYCVTRKAFWCWITDLQEIFTDQSPSAPEPQYEFRSRNAKPIFGSISVETEDDRQNLLVLSRYFHDCRDIDTDIDAVNVFAHLYLRPEAVVVQDSVECSVGPKTEIATLQEEAIKVATAPRHGAGVIAWLMQESDRSSSELAWVVVALSRAYPSGRRRTPVEGLDPIAWPNTVFIDLPTGQVAWHYPESFASPFEDLPPYTRPYDQHHRNQVKYRLLSLVRMVNRQYLQDFIDFHRHVAMTCDELNAREIADIGMWCEKLERFIKAVERGHLEGCDPRVFWG